MTNKDHIVDIKNTVLQLMAIKGDAKRISFHPKRDRFNMPHSSDTSVHEDLNANRIFINGSSIAIATQYPFKHQLEAQLQMMVDNHTPVLVVLASNRDIQKNRLPEYFSWPDTYGQIKTHSTPVRRIELGNSIEAYIFKLEVTGYKVSIDIPVIHVPNWPDHQTVSPETTSNLVTLIESTLTEKIAFYKKENNPILKESLINLDEFWQRQVSKFEAFVFLHSVSMVKTNNEEIGNLAKPRRVSL